MPSDGMNVHGATVRDSGRWWALVTVQLDGGDDVWVLAGVPDYMRDTAALAGSDHGMVGVWPAGDSLDAWCPDSLRRDVEFLAREGETWDAVHRAAVRAYRESRP